MNWEIFQGVFARLMPLVTAITDSTMTAAAGWIQPYLLGVVPLVIIGRLIWASLSPQKADIGEIILEGFVGGVLAVALTQAAYYNPYVRDFILVNLIQGLGSAMAGVSGGEALTASMFDAAWNRSIVAGLRFWRNIPTSITGVGMVGVFLIFMLSAIAAIGFAFMVWLKAVAFVSFLVGVGPLFVGLWPIPLVRGMFRGWVNTLMANVVLSVFCVVLMTAVITVQEETLNAMMASVQQGGARSWFRTQPVENEVAQMLLLFGGLLANALLAFIALNLPGTAASITHGFSGFGHSKTGAGIFGGGSGGGSSPSPSPSPAPQSPPPSSAQTSAPPVAPPSASISSALGAVGRAIGPPPR